MVDDDELLVDGIDVDNDDEAFDDGTAILSYDALNGSTLDGNGVGTLDDDNGIDDGTLMDVLSMALVIMVLSLPSLVNELPLDDAAIDDG